MIMNAQIIRLALKINAWILATLTHVERMQFVKRFHTFQFASAHQILLVTHMKSALLVSSGLFISLKVI